MILTADFGTSITKVALWDEGGLVAVSGSPVATSHPAPGRAEQDPAAWWGSLVEACRKMEAYAPGGLQVVDAVGCTGARQTVVLADAAGAPLGPAILWSDARAAVEADRLGDRSGPGDGGPARSGIPLDAASVAAKIAWLADHEGGRVRASAWVLAPRDLMVWRLTGTVATDPTMASRSGLYDVNGSVIAALAGAARTRLPPVLPSDQVTGRLEPQAAAALGVRAGTPVVIGAADRPCEVLGSGATGSRPMVSWGTTANLSVPAGDRPPPAPPGLVVSRAADGGWLIEGGLSAAGSFLAWLGRLTGRPPEELAALARRCPPGARGVLAVPWLDGARAPWWRPDAGAAVLGLSAAHGPGDLARAVFESVAWEVRRCLDVVASCSPAAAGVEGLTLGGAGAGIAVWLDVLTGITGLPARRRRSGQAASAGAALLAAAAVGIELDLERMDPVDLEAAPDPAAVDRYLALRARVDGTAAALAASVGDPPCT